MTMVTGVRRRETTVRSDVAGHRGALVGVEAMAVVVAGQGGRGGRRRGGEQKGRLQEQAGQQRADPRQGEPRHHAHVVTRPAIPTSPPTPKEGRLSGI